MARTARTRGVVVDQNDRRRLGQQSVAQQDAHIDRRLRPSALTQSDALDEAAGVVEQNDPTLFVGQFAHVGTHEFIHLLCGADYLEVGQRLFLSAPPSEFHRSLHGDGLCLADAVVLHQFLHTEAVEQDESVVAVVQHLCHEFDGVLLRAAGADEDGEQLCFRECFAAFGEKFLARTFVGRQFFDVEHGVVWLRV